MRLLFLNSLKGLKKKKIQMLGIILMVTLSTAIFTSMNMALDRMEDRYYSYLDQQNVEYLSVDVNIDYKSISSEKIDSIINDKLSNMTSDEKFIINTYKSALKMDLDSSDNPLNSTVFSYQLSSIFSKYDALIDLQKEKLDSIKDKYNFNYEQDISKALKNGDTYLKVIPYNEDKNINKAYLVKGHLPKNDKEITILPKYAEAHNLKIGDDYKIGDTKYKIVGFTYAPDYIYPLVAYLVPVFDEETNNIVYINNDNYKDISGTEEKTFSIFYKKGVKRAFELDQEIDFSKKVSDDNMLKILTNNGDDKSITMSTFTITRLGRIAALQLEFKTDRLFAEYFLYLLLGVSIFIIVIVTKKRIDDEKLQIGVLKSLGYSRFSIAVSYLVYPVIGSIIGGLLGYTIGLLLHSSIASIYVSYFLVPLSNFSIDLKYLATSILIPIVFLSILSYLIAIFMLRKKPLDLLKEGSNLKVNLFSKITNKLTKKLPFKYRFKYSLAFRSVPKLLVVSLTSFFTGMLIVLTLIGMNLMDNVVEKSFSGMKYDYMVYMNQIENEKLNADGDYIISSNLYIDKVIKENGKTKKMDDDVTISITGMDLDSKYMKIKDSKNNNLIDKIRNDNYIIINSNMENLYDLKIGDTLVCKIDDNNSIKYKIAGISEEFMNVAGYVNREGFSKKIGYNKNVYTTIISKDKKFNNLDKLSSDDSKKIATVLNFKDLKNNIKKQLDVYNASVYVVILFASIMALIIIGVIANIVVEENKKTISLMKVMGYKNKEISGIVLNIYTPIIIISYLLSIPAMIKLLEIIMNSLAGDMSMTIPITLDPVIAIIGLIGLLVAYYIALLLSRKVLNKVPLAVALKRE